MAINRAAAASYIGEEYGPMVTAAGLAATDTRPNALADVIDQALLIMGVADDDLADAVVSGAVARLDYEALLNYTFTRKAWRRLTPKQNTKIGKGSLEKQESTLVSQVWRAYVEAARGAQARGFAVTLGDDDNAYVGHLTADVLEPAVAGGEYDYEWPDA